MRIHQATPELRPQIIKLLQAEKLPTEDLPADLTDFLVAENEGCTVGVIGMERYGELGLLRSMVVHPDYRNRSVATALVTSLQNRASETGIHTLYLLTETASEYFIRKGFNKLQRDEAPEAIKASSEFSHTCPVSAQVMVKTL
ncbi:arsenic resistance N-acetyltransferase ArsN2 [Paraflavitalea sp. CAU 1676]|uniref:arsenic resistance N-acetyltransferase ArsN2 n=1 Tax=Paraflavitalea sp. CAU 1676 TaxID=3032598 RepID=UPI0023DCE6E8|nr:arsenic resistance N-acetyltransferase ArsN2 [Paraflavitalea sp. CAU 1676]MDF2193159.1 arsenic resistance N-acetyltransferase ArsN2 [Paraflavitalea sp. CAU 1676]